MSIYMLVPGVDGGVTAAGYKGAFQIDSFSWGVATNASIGSASGGAGAGKITFSPLTVTKKISKGSIPLFMLAAQGSLIQQMTITVVRDSGMFAEQITFKLVETSTYQQSDDTGSPIEETLNLVFGAVSITTNANSDGSGTETGGWSVVTNTPD